MRIQDWCLWLDTPGRQLNLSVFLGVIASVCFFLCDFCNQVNFYFYAILKGISGFLTIYLLGYVIVLSNQMLKKHYK